MAGDVVTLMRRLGHETFAVVGHDRGTYVAMRAALDHPDAPSPHRSHSRGGPLQEGQAWYGAHAPGRVAVMGEENHADLLAAIHDQDTVRAMLENYRAGLGVDRAADEADRAGGRRVTCPTLVLWSARDDLEGRHGDPRKIWAGWTTDLRGGGPMDSGHHMAEEAPEGLAAELVGFLAM